MKIHHIAIAAAFLIGGSYSVGHQQTTAELESEHDACARPSEDDPTPLATPSCGDGKSSAIEKAPLLYFKTLPFDGPCYEAGIYRITENKVNPDPLKVSTDDGFPLIIMDPTTKGSHGFRPDLEYTVDNGLTWHRFVFMKIRGAKK